MNSRVERGRRALERLQRHRAGDIGHPREAFRAQKGEPADRMHRLGAIE